MINEERVDILEEIKDYGLVYDSLVEQLKGYVETNGIKSLVLGISGGIDSTVCAVICREVCRQTGIKFIGRSLTISNTEEEYTTASMVGNAFVEDFKEVNLYDLFADFQQVVLWEGDAKDSSPIALGNIQARMRMIYLYNLAGINKGIVIDTLNFTEELLGFWTLHGDVGDYAPIVNLWKTEVYQLAYWIYKNKCETKEEEEAMNKAITIEPTDGLGISKSDVEQFGAETYDEVDAIFKKYFTFVDLWCETINQLSSYYIDDFISMLEKDSSIKKRTISIAENVLNRYKNTKYKRSPMPRAEIYL